MTVELTPEMVLALKVMLDEMTNSGTWRTCLEDEEQNDVDKGLTQFKELNLN